VTTETEKLVFSAKNGDLEAFGQLAEKFYPTLTAIAFAHTKSRHYAEDAAQETLKRAILSVKTLKNPKKFAPWLSGICRNVSRDITTRQTTQLTNEDTIEAPKSDRNHDNELKNEIVRKAIASLPDTDREIIILKFYNNQSYDQISELLAISKGAINGRIKRAKFRIAKHLQQNNYPEI